MGSFFAPKTYCPKQIKLSLFVNASFTARHSWREGEEGEEILFSAVSLIF
jgi:hypothetical protein